MKFPCVGRGMLLARRAAAGVLALVLSACAANPVGILGELRLDRSLDGGVERLFPLPPEVPRYLYVGDLYGEPNFIKQEDQRASRLSKAVNWLVGMFENVPVPTLMRRPAAGAVDARGRVIVTDVGGGALYVFDEKGGEMQIWQDAGLNQPFRSPAGIAIDAGGDVLVSDAELARVVRLSADGSVKGTFGGGVLERPTGLAYDPRQNLVYVADTQAHDIKVFDDAGNLVGLIGRPGNGPGEFNMPAYLACAKGELYVTDTINSRIQVFNAETGQPVRRFGERGLYLGNLVRPKGVTVDGEGNIYVVESYYDHLLVYTAEGQLLMGIGGAGGEAGKFYLPAGVWTDGRERIYVADMFNSRVSVFQFLGGG